MIRDTRFWVVMLVFQVLFGLAVFAITREYYRQDTTTVTSRPSVAEPSLSLGSQGLTDDEVARMSSIVTDMAPSTDPMQIYREAEDAFANRQYDRAAQLYERLLEFSPNDAEIHNNLGLTLFYLGRADDALRTLNDGIAADAEHQRIWLTLGYVNGQLGNTQQARAALENAISLGNDESIRESARNMLAELPE